MSPDVDLRPMSLRDWIVIGGGILMLAVSFRPWYGTQVASSGAFGSGAYETSASAWSASTRWSVAIALCLLASALWVLYRPAGAWRRQARRLALAALILASAVMGWQVYEAAIEVYCSEGCVTLTRITSLGGSEAGNVTQSYVGDIRRDHLVVHTDNGYESGFRSGLYLALGTLVAMVVAAGTALRPGPS